MIEFQMFTLNALKMRELENFSLLAKIAKFAHVKKKQYLCTRF